MDTFGTWDDIHSDEGVWLLTVQCVFAHFSGQKISTKNNSSLHANNYDPQTTASYSGENSDPITIQFSGGRTGMFHLYHVLLLYLLILQTTKHTTLYTMYM